MTITCPQCSSENDAHRLFCNFCGTTLELVCPTCAFSNRVGDRYCGGAGCGVRLGDLTADQPAGSAITLDEAKRDELRTITVMMADLDGFAEVAEAHGREQQTAVMNTVFERLAKTHIVDEFDGYIDKFLDGDIMALFGAPIAHEDAPERALRAAVRMHQELRALHEEGVIPQDTPLRLRIGLNTGPVRVGGVGAGGRMEYTAMGDTVNLAARLMTACAWGSSLISVNTHRRVAPSFELEELEPVKVKGKAKPVRIWSVLAEKRRAARVEIAQAEGMSRLVGRQAQLELAIGAYRRACGGQGGTVGIRGEAGIGKSRLVFELQQYILETDARFVEGRCLSYGVNIAFLPWRDVLSELCGFDDADSADQRRAKLEAALAAVGLPTEPLTAPLAFLVGLDLKDAEFNQLDPQERLNRVRDATFALLEATSRQRPLALFLDDLQWCDSASRDILDDLVQRCPGARLLLLLAFRPDFTHSYEGLPQFELIAPQRLTIDQTRDVVGSLLCQRGLIGDETRVDRSLAQAVYNKAQGNPFFIDQTVTALVERAELSGRPTIDFRRGRLLISEDELAGLVPDSVEEILLARIDKLPEAPRSLLQAASVAMIGRYFRRSALEYCVGSDQLDALLDTLETRELIRLENRTETDSEFVFEHALTRDVAYNNLLRAERRRLHGEVGHYIEHHYAASLSAYTDDLSYHFYNSAEAAKALHYLPQSATRAARVFANQQAVLHYKRALERADEVAAGAMPELPRLRLDVLKGLTGVQALTGDREGLGYGRQRLDLARELDDRDAIIDASYMLAHQYTALGQFDDAQAYWTQVRGEYEAAGAWDGVRDSEYGIGNLCYLQGRYDAALEHFQRALDIQVERLEFEPFAHWVAHNNIAAASEALGRFRDVLEACHLCQDMLARLPDDDPMRMRLECYTSGNLGSAHRNLGNLSDALTAYQRTLEITQATGEKNVEAEVRHWLGRTLTLMGRLHEARAHLDEAAVLARETGSSRWEAGALVALADLTCQCGDDERAGELLQQAREVLDRVGELAGRGEIGVLEARMRSGGEPEAAAELLQAVLDAAAAEHNEVDRAAALAELAAVREHGGQHEAAAELTAQAIALCDTLGFQPVRVRALRVAARLQDAGTAEMTLAEALRVARAMPSIEETVAALGLRAALRQQTDPQAAWADVGEAERVLATAEAEAGADYVAAARERHLGTLVSQRTS